MSKEQLTVTMPLAEYERIKQIEDVLHKLKRDEPYIKETTISGHYSFFHKIEIVNKDQIETVLIAELKDEIQKLKEIKTPTIWQLLKKKISL